MNGNFSLSQSLGGLRIANPDGTGLLGNSQTLEEQHQRTRSSGASSSHSTYSRNNQQGQASLSPIQHSPASSYSSVGFDPGVYSINEPSASVHSPTFPQLPANQPLLDRDLMDRNSLAVARPGQQQPPTPPSAFNPTRPHRSVLGAFKRPVSGIYTHPNPSNASAASSQGSYRLGNEYSHSTRPSVTRARTDSRGDFGGTPRVPSESDSGMEESRRGSQAVPSSAVLPPRRSSRRRLDAGPSDTGAYGAAPTEGTPYGLECGPLPSSEEWKERGAAVGVKQDVDAQGKPVSRLIKKGVKDFNFGRTLGEGSYSTVLAATDRQTNREYAIKVLDKRHIIKEKKVKYVNIEKDTLNRLTEHPGIVRLYYTFQDERSLYYVLDLASGGELLGVLKKTATFDEECTRFYGAQILDAVDYMHSRGVIHRDLKPENVLLNDQMHVKITDFGKAKILDARIASNDVHAANGTTAGDPLDGAATDRAVSFVGTAEYVSPELLTDKNACKASDLWAFGCIVYQLLAGRPPFKAANEYQTFQKIVKLDYSFPDSFPELARDLVEKLLVLEPQKRPSIEQIKSHPFFGGIQWGRSLWKQKAPRLKSFVPPAQAPIKLNGNSESAGANIPVRSGPPGTATPGGNPQRPQPRVITELPPPSQLDIEWSPVLTKTNERILKLGNLNVLAASAPHSPSSKNGHEAPGDGASKLARFFGGSATKKRQRLVMITSSARIIIVAAGGDEKKTKMEVSLLGAGTTSKSYKDPKGLTAWCVDTREKHFTFEDPKATTSDPDGSVYSTQEWLDAIERAKELAISQNIANSYSADSAFNELSSSLSNNASAGAEASIAHDGAYGARNILRKDFIVDSDSLKAKKRFSKRQSKSGLAAVF